MPTLAERKCDDFTGVLTSPCIPQKEMLYMSIRGIDTQIMINRLPDNAKETSEMMKRPEVYQDNTALQGRVNDAQDQSRVAKMSESELEQLRTDVDEGSGNGHGHEGGAKRKKKNEEEVDRTMLVPGSDHRIDIRI